MIFVLDIIYNWLLEKRARHHTIVRNNLICFPLFDFDHYNC